MTTKKLSPREEDIVELCVAGLSNAAIAQELGLSIKSVNTYWLRIRLKVGGLGRADAAAIVVKERAERALRDANIERAALAAMIADHERIILENRAALALLQLAMDQIQSTVWATDRDLTLCIIANGEQPSNHAGVRWEVGKTVQEIFKTTDATHPAIAAHLLALSGSEAQLRLEGEFENMVLRVLPLQDESGEPMGCISVLNVVGH